MELKAYAKINWDLHVLGRRPDGFHELDTVMVNISLHDTLTFEPHAQLEFWCSDPALPTDERNLVVKAARMLAWSSGQTGGARIRLTKRIPAGGGLGGGSSDAACALLGLNRLWNLNWSRTQLHNVAAELGSDVAFFLYGGWCRCRGRGEIVEPLPGAEHWPAIKLLLVLPKLHVATPQVYQKLHSPPVIEKKAGTRSLTELAEALKSDLWLIREDPMAAGRLHNSLTAAARAVEPGLEPVQRILETCCPGRWLMSGSGGVHFAVCKEGSDEENLSAAFSRLATPGVRLITVTTFTSLI